MVAYSLLQPVMPGIIRIPLPIIAPVIRITFTPFAPSLPLIITIGLIIFQLVPLPLSLAGSLAFTLGTVFLIGILRPDLNKIMTIFTPTFPDHICFLNNLGY